MAYKTQTNTVVIGNNMQADANLGFKKEIKGIFENYTNHGINLGCSDFLDIITTPGDRQEFISNLMESITTSPVMTNGDCVKAPFYSNYADRLQQLEENSIQAIAVESAMTAYAPIVSYSPFFLKKQWISCIMKDVLMTEVPTAPIIEIGFEKRYLKDLSGNEYEMPNVFYNAELMKQLMNSATGLPFAETAVALPLNNVDVLTDTYIPGIVVKDRAETLTADLKIWKVRVVDTQSTPATHDVLVNITVDLTTRSFLNGKVKYDVKDGGGTVVETINDEIIGNVDFINGRITVLAANGTSTTSGKITHIFFRGKTVNKFNNRSLDVVRRNERHTFHMPESGPRLNTSVTIEEAADALVLQKIDIIADNIDTMGSVLGNMEDTEIRSFLDASYTAQESAGTGPEGYGNLVEKSEFDTLPYVGYSHGIPDWLKAAREYFERLVVQLKDKLKTSDATIVAVGHPNLVRFLQDGVNWVFTDNTEISGMKVSYNFGICTAGQDKVHIITSRYFTENDGLKLILIPTTNELITFKHYKYSTVIDRGYRNPLQPLVPNIMATHRTLTFEILPVQGKFSIKGRELNSPATLTR